MSDEKFNLRTQKAFDFYADATKQLITLSTAIIAVVITFAKDILGNLPGLAKLSLIAALTCYLVSVWYGLGTLLGLTGALQPFKVMKELARQGQAPPQSPPDFESAEWPIASIYAKPINQPSKVQVVLFGIATGLVVITAAIVAVPITDSKTEEAALKELESQWVQACAQRDGAALERILSSDYLMTNASGGIVNKKQFISDVTSQHSAFEPVLPTNIKINIYGETATVRGLRKPNAQGESQGQADLIRYINIYVNQQGRWQMVATQETSFRQSSASTPLQGNVKYDHVCQAHELFAAISA